LSKNEELNYEDLSELEYTSNVLKESLRMWPPTTLLAREVTKECYIDKYRIPSSIFIDPKKFCY
jgi:cytochrome P450